MASRFWIRLIHQIFTVSVSSVSKGPDFSSCLRLLEINQFTHACTRRERRNVLLSRRESDSSFSGFVALATHTTSRAILASAFDSAEGWVTELLATSLVLEAILGPITRMS